MTFASLKARIRITSFQTIFVLTDFSIAISLINLVVSSLFLNIFDNKSRET